MKVKNLVTKAFFAILTIAVFASCSDDDSPKPEPTPKGWGVNISVDVSQDIFSAADVYLQYIDGDGKQKIEKVSEPSIRKTIVTLDFSQTLGYRVLLKEKATNDITTEYCKVFYRDASVLAVIDTEGKPYATQNITFRTDKSIKKDVLSDWISKRAVLLNSGYKVTEDKKDFKSETIEWLVPDFI